MGEIILRGAQTVNTEQLQ